MAGDPAFTELLLGMGLRSFSMHPTQVSSIKKRILRVDSSAWSRHVDLICEADDPQSTYGRLQTAVPGVAGGRTRRSAALFCERACVCRKPWHRMAGFADHKSADRRDRSSGKRSATGV